MNTRSLRTLLFLGIGAVAAFGLTACADDTTGPEGEEVTAEQAQTVGQALGGILAGSFGDQLSADSEGSYTLDTTRSCEVSGTVHASGSGSVTSSTSGDTETRTISLDAQVTADECASLTEQEERLLTITTNSPFEITASGETVTQDTGSGEQELVEAFLTVDWAGSFHWDLEGEGSHDCDVDMTLTLSAAGTSFDLSVSGTTCGHDVQGTISGT